MTAIETTPTLTPGKWTIEPAHSEVAFSVRHLGLTKVNGRFNSFSGTVTIADDLSADPGSDVRADVQHGGPRLQAHPAPDPACSPGPVP